MVGRNGTLINRASSFEHTMIAKVQERATFLVMLIHGMRVKVSASLNVNDPPNAVHVGFCHIAMNVLSAFSCYFDFYATFELF